MISKTMEFCNKGMVWADPLPPSYGQRPYFYICFLLDPSLNKVVDLWNSKKVAILDFSKFQKGGFFKIDY